MHLNFFFLPLVSDLVFLYLLFHDVLLCVFFPHQLLRELVTDTPTKDDKNTKLFTSCTLSAER